MKEPAKNTHMKGVHPYSPAPDPEALETCFGTVTLIGRTNGPGSQASVGPTPTFPGRKFAAASSFAEAYFAQITAAACSVDKDTIHRAAHILANVYAAHGTVYACGNGGSAAISNHLSFDEVFVYQLRTMAIPGDALITISSSGDSENVVRAASWAKANGISVISMTGFSGGRSAEIADVNLHVDANNYGIIEDVHQALMHILAQYIRQAHMADDLVAQRKF